MKNLAIAFLLCLFSALNIHAVVISGKVVSASDSREIPAASVSLKDKDGNFIIQSQTDINGKFRLESSNTGKECVLTASFVGFTPNNTAIIVNESTEINLGNIFLEESQDTKLDEVTVTANKIVQKVDKYIVIPQKDEVARSSKAIELLEQIPLPGLSVDRGLSKITISGGSPVFMVNGKERDANYFSNLDPDKILRIEYNNVPGIRYIDRGNTGIINIVLKEAEEGGSITTQVASAFTTGFVNGLFHGTYNYKKSQFSLFYNCGYRNYDEWLAVSNEKFIGDDKHYIERDQKGVNSPMYYFDNTITADYTYMHDANTMLVVEFKNNICPTSGGNDGLITEIKDNVTWEYDRVQRRKSNTYNPTLDVFFSKKLSHGQSIELNAVGNISNGYSERTIWYNYADAENDISIPFRSDNDGWSIAAEAVYGKTFTNVNTRFGVQYLHNYAENEYREVEGLSKMKKDNTYVYGELSGRLGKVGYSLGSGVKVLGVNDYTDSRTFVRNLTTAGLQYATGKNWSLSYNFSYSPSLPSLSQLSPIVSQTDDITYTAGNPDLKPSEQIVNTIRANFQYNKFSGSLVARYTHHFNPITNPTVYDAENEVFIYIPRNGKYLYSAVVGTQLSYKKLFNHFNISVSGYFSRHQTKGTTYKHHLNNFYSNLSIQGFFGNWVFGLGQCLATQRYLSGTTIGSYERMSNIYAQYKYRNFYFAAMMLCPFQKDGFRYEKTRMSKVNPGHYVNWTKDNGNMVTLSVAYQVNLGKSFKKNRKTLSNGGYDNGMVQ